MSFDIVVFIVIPVLLVIAVTVLAGRRARVTSADYDNDSMSFIGGVLNALFTVVLAFFVVFAWQNGADLESSATAESDALLDTYWQMDIAPQQEADRIRGLLRQYATQVVDQEWELLDEGQTAPQVNDTISQLRTAVMALPTDADAVALAREKALENVRTIDENHRKRVDMSSNTDAFTVALMAGTIIGAVLMVVFPLVFGMSTRPANVVSMVILTLCLGASLYVSWQLLHPLRGFFGADPTSFRAAIDVMANRVGI